MPTLPHNTGQLLELGPHGLEEGAMRLLDSPREIGLVVLRGAACVAIDQTPELARDEPIDAEVMKRLLHHIPGVDAVNERAREWVAGSPLAGHYSLLPFGSRESHEAHQVKTTTIGWHIDHPSILVDGELEGPLTLSVRVDKDSSTVRTFSVIANPDLSRLMTDGRLNDTLAVNLYNDTLKLDDEAPDPIDVIMTDQRPGDIVVFRGLPWGTQHRAGRPHTDPGSPDGTKALITGLLLASK